MIRGILITNGGPHPADKWAAESAAHIADLIQINEASESPEAVAARKAKPRFELDLADALEGHHKTIQTQERAALDEHGAQRYGHSVDPAEHVPETVDEAIACVAEVAAGTPFAEHFTKPDTVAVVRSILMQHFATAMQIERSWHRDLGGKTWAA